VEDTTGVVQHISGWLTDRSQNRSTTCMLKWSTLFVASM